MPHRLGRVVPTKSGVRLPRGITIPTKAKAWRVVTPGGKLFKAVKAAKFSTNGKDFLVMRLLPYKGD
jgi:hypothetical protein